MLLHGVCATWQCPVGQELVDKKITTSREMLRGARKRASENAEPIAVHMMCSTSRYPVGI